ncbi:class I SAM-dependent methyltransferase [Aporhodopirellula aestuarii]|uniref:Class I SAM-dependent methyltransferase n=1 Tax=Aporhodopirellula aestuarii TaxID=2950107 RepID=A0ABT0UC20_9BACT|nr:class I SAM-dependent methyltransferase [Aporhodopirellula aestuarii]MCM2374463.1 class I SAM-dependent methyltransferase [Aporhodopirellula aestuarii]
MSDTSYSHHALGEITDTLQARLNELSNDPSSKANQDTITSAQRAVLIDIASLQVKAKRTFGEAANQQDAWWVTRRGLQQSTHHCVASLKASWMGDRPVADLCCGLGSDLIALAKRGPVTGVDFDPDVLAFTAANLQVARVSAELRTLDVTVATSADLIAGATYLHVDPDRRADGQRHTDANDLVPDWSRVTELAKLTRGGLIKLAPATQLSDDQTADLHRTWISASGSVREQTAIYGELFDNPWMLEHGLRPGQRSAIALRNRIPHVFAAPAEDTSVPNSSGAGIGEWIIDPDASIRAAGLTTSFAREIGGRVVGSASGFLTCDSLEQMSDWGSMAMAARVIEVVGCDDRKLRRCFRTRKAHPELIKVRGSDLDPTQLGRRMKSCGDTPLGLWIGRDGKRTFAAITEPIASV